MTFGIICAMPEELHALSERLTDRTETVLGGKTYLAGTIENQAVVLVKSGIGKVEAGITAEHLITLRSTWSLTPGRPGELARGCTLATW